MYKIYLKRLNYLAVLMTLVLGLFITSCSEDDTITPPPAVDEAKILVEYLETNGDFINTAAPAMIKATDVNTALLTNASSIHIIDIRSDVDFAKGHIQNAVNVTLANLVAHMESINASSFENIVIACYSGQTASFAGSCLRLLGYDNVKVLKWGMSSWNNTLDKWSNGIGNARATEWETSENTKPALGKYPVLSTGKTTGAEILKARVQEVLAAGFAKISNADVYANLSNYYIVNYWPKDQYLDPGHIPGAYQYTPKVDLKSTTLLKTLPTDKDVVIYCYTGQTSAFVTAYLKVLGYNAKSLLSGANAMIYDQMVAKGMTIWNAETESHDFDLVTD